MRIYYYTIVINTMLLYGILGAGCKISEQAELDIHRPRITGLWPFFQSRESDKALLAGIFVDVNSSATSPDGKSWETAFKTIGDALNFCSQNGSCKGRDIIIAAGTYKDPRLNIKDMEHLRFIGGYKAGEKYERVRQFKYDKPDEWVILDGDGQSMPLVSISGKSEHIIFAGGFWFTNINVSSGIIKGTPAMVIKGDALKPVKHVIIQHSVFDNVQNSVSTEKGGALFAQYVSDLRLENVDAFNMAAAEEGGAFYFSDIDGLNLLGGNWEHNEAQGGNRYGGAAYLTKVTKLKMEGQVIKSNGANFGGGIYLTKIKNENIGPLRVEDHKTPRYGLGIAIDDCQDLTLNGISIVNNQNIDTGARAGGVHITDSRNIVLDFTGAEVKNNHTTEGGVIEIDGFSGKKSYNIHIKNGRFESNKSVVNVGGNGNGGAIYAYQTSGLTISNMQFVSNEADNGGAVYLDTPGGVNKIDSCIFDGNKSTKHGGGLYIRNGLVGNLLPEIKIEINNSQFLHNEAKENGGAVLAEITKYSIEFNNSLFKKNRAYNFGGALALDGQLAAAKFIIGEHTQFFDNESERGAGGGAMYVTFRVFNVVWPPAPPMPKRQLVFYNINSDQRRNITGKILTPVVQPGTAGTMGNFLRVGTQAITDITPNDINVGARVFTPAGLTPLNGLIAFDSVGSGTALWNLLQINWGAEVDVYAW
jgi:hypothetical protein